MTMTPEVQAEYDRVLRAVVLRKGALTDPGSHAYGWIAQDWDHKSWCTFTSEAKPIESNWTEFADSFSEYHPTKHGVDVPNVHCACGAVENRTVRWDANPYEMMTAVFEEMHRARTTT